MSNETADRLTQISDELKGILEARLQELAGAMRGAEQVTRQIVSTEMEISRYNQIASDTGSELTALRDAADDARKRADEVSKQRAGVVSEREAAREAVSRGEREVRELAAGVGDLRARQRSLELESESLRREAEEIAGRLKSAEENVARLRRLREELMQQMSLLSASGAKD